MKAFFDTNVMVYAVDPSAGLRHVPAQELMARHMQERTLVLSTQVLQEGYSVLTRKKQVSTDLALEVVSTWAEEKVVPASVDLVLAGLALSRRYQLSVWDGLIVQAALQAGCDVVFSEDLQAGMRFGDLEVINPFTPGAHEARPAPRARVKRGPRSAARQG